MNAPAIVHVPAWYPMMFTGPMVRAVLERRKTKTRRVVKPQPPAGCEYTINGAQTHACCHTSGPIDARSLWVPPVATSSDHRVRCPYGGPGDRLWVRETFAWCNHEGLQPADEVLTHVLFRADGEARDVDSLRWTPSIHMPRQISRISLAVTSVAVERLQAITEEDARAEGAPARLHAGDTDGFLQHRHGFMSLWQNINGRRPGCAWADNPWVWVIGFGLLEVRDV